MDAVAVAVAAAVGVLGGVGAARLADAVGQARYGPGTAGHDPEDAALAPLEAPTSTQQRIGLGVIGAVGMAGLAAGLPDGEVLVLFGSLFLAYLAAMVVDLQFLRLPDVFTYPAAVVALGGAAVLSERFDGVAFSGALWGAAIFAGFLLVARVGYQLVRGREGHGSRRHQAGALARAPRLAGSAARTPTRGTIGSIQLVIYAALVGNLLGAVGGLVLLRRFDRSLPFGPALVAGWALVVALSETLLA